MSPSKGTNLNQRSNFSKSKNNMIFKRAKLASALD